MVIALPKKLIIRVPLFIVLIIYMFISGCETLKDSSKYAFSEGFYSYKAGKEKSERVYVVATPDTIKVYNPADLFKERTDTIKSISIAFPANIKPLEFKNYVFTKRTFDLDLLTVLFKYRPPVSGFPNQLNATFNGAVYAGYRSDIYKLSYKKSPLKVDQRTITHYAYSIGFFSGIGTDRIDEYVTLNKLNIQYDGFVNLSGIAAIVALDKLNFGLTFGYDYLLDNNKDIWIYQLKSWFGLSLGLNLN
jgi:hypothetical protein